MSDLNEFLCSRRKQRLVALSNLVCPLREVWSDCYRLLKEISNSNRKGCMGTRLDLKEWIEIFRAEKEERYFRQRSKMCRGKVRRGHDVVGDW